MRRLIRTLHYYHRWHFSWHLARVKADSEIQ